MMNDKELLALADRLEASEKTCFDAGQHVVAMDIQDVRTLLIHLAAASPGDAVRAMQPAIDALTNGQEQADADGIMVRVSRQALDEVLAFIQSAAHGGGTKSDGGVKVRELEWRDHRPDSFPEPAWSAQTSFGFYNIEEVSASDSPAYVVRLHAHHFVADKDSLDEAKAAAQADYEARIKSALVEVPADAGMREAFVRVLASLAAAISILERTPKAKRAVASDKMFDQMLDDYRKALEAGRSALTAPDATTKSDGGAKAGSSPILASKEDQRSDTHGMMPVGDNAANVGSTGVGPSDPSSTRSDVTVEAKHLVSSARAFLAHFDPCDLAEDKSQQWQSLEHQCNRVERALLDNPQFQIRRKK